MTPARSPVASRLRAAREELRTHGPSPGRDWCRAWTAEVDAALVALHAPVAALGRFTVAAAGGYGRRELCPWSDVDLLVLHDGVGDEDLAGIVRAVVYPLWDAGLQVGYAVRGRRDAIAAADDVDSATATLDARRVAGDPSLVSDVREGALQRLRRRRSDFLEGLTAADVDRRGRSGDAAEVLEPDLKNGAGGLRDVQSLRWAAAALVGTTGLDPLVSARYLGVPERSRLARAYDRLLAIRVALHLERDRADDTLHVECQQPVARRLGYVDGDDDRDTAAHRLLRDLSLDARTVDHVHRRAWSLVSADAIRGRRSDGNEGRSLAWAPSDRDRFPAMRWRGDPALAELDDVRAIAHRPGAAPATSRGVAVLVGDRATLACLHLLATADGVATGPSAWTSWKASPVSTLSAEVIAVFDDEEPIATDATVREARRLAPRLGVDPDVVRDHLAQLPARYPAAVPPRAIVRQAGVAAAPLAPAEVRTRVTPGPRAPDGDTVADELDVIALDSPGLFAKVAGVLALHGGSVLEANAFTRDDGVAVDMFVVRRPTDATGSWWAAVEGDIDEAVAGRLAVRARVARKAATERRRPGADVATTVGCRPDPSGSATIVEVRTADRLGVLYRIASALAELELDIVLARISTVGHEVVDVFFVRDASGNPLDEDHVAELVLAVESGLEG